MRMTHEFFEMIKTRLEPLLARQATNYRAPISVGETLTLTIRYLATGESYTSLSCQFRVGRSTISKFLQKVCRAIQDEFTREYLRCPTIPDEWKQLETEFRIRWNVPHALGALDGKQVALKKPKNSGALYHNYKGFFSIVMLALVDGQYKFRWVDVGTAGSCSDDQIFNTCHPKRQIDDGSIGFPYWPYWEFIYLFFFYVAFCCYVYYHGLFVLCLGWCGCWAFLLLFCDKYLY